MAAIREKIVLRKRRKDGERLPNRIRLDKVGENDTLIIEIVVDKKNGITQWYRFLPEQMTGKRSVAFTVSGGEVYWLSGAKPTRIYESELPEEPQPMPAPIHKDPNPNVIEPTPPQAKLDGRKKSKKKKVLVFDSKQKLLMVCADTEAASQLTHILKDSIDKLCKSKKPSQETGYSFRKLWKNLGPDTNVLDFSLTLNRFDEMCKRTPKTKS